jgi:glycosyltransferase involved in cell wall biosynthesis
MISIIIPVYNGEKTLEGTLNDIERQTYNNFEVIIVNDGSTDNTISVLDKFFKRGSLKNNYHFISQENKGAPSARNKGWKKSKGDFLFFCDADAVLKPDILEKMIAALENNKEASYAYASFYWGSKLFKLWPFDAEKLKKMPYIHTMSLIRRSDFPVTGWDEGIKKLQDWDLWLTMLEQGKTGVFINDVLFKVQPVGTISSWLPAFAYKAFPFLPKVKKYKKALEIIKKKHNLL